jgi:hypothetical protein
MSSKEMLNKLRAKAPKFAQKVAPIYAMLNWKILSATNAMGIPDHNDITHLILGHIDSLESAISEQGMNRFHSIESGGIKVGYERNELSGYEFYIKFQITEWEHAA